MPVKDFLRKNALYLVITLIFGIWTVYLISTSLSSVRNIHFINVLTTGNFEDVSSQYSSSIPLLRYFLEPFIGLTFIFAFNSDPTGIIPLFLVVYAAIRIALLAIDNTLLHNNRKKEVIFRYFKDVLEFAVKYGSILLLVFGASLVVGYFTLGFLFVANYFETFFHIGSIIGLILIVGKGLYNAIIYFKPKGILKFRKSTSKNPVVSTLIRIKRELFYFWTAFLLLFILNFSFLSIQFPTQHITATDLAPDEFLFDFHVHTTMSDGHLTPEQRVMWYIDQGIHGAAFTDHHHPRGALRAREFVETHNLDFVVLIGQEFTDDPEDIHLNFFGIEEEITPEGYTEGPYGINRMNASEAIKYVKANGGYVIVNHYHRNASAPFSYEQLRDWGVDGFEIGYSDKDREIRDFCLNNSLICITATDEHLTRELNEFVRLKLTDPTNKTLAHIMENLRRNNHSCIVIPELDYFRNFQGDFSQLNAFDSYLLNLDAYQALSWVIWSVLFYGLTLLIIRPIKNRNLEGLAKKIVLLD